MSKKNIQMKVLGESGYDEICPVPAEHASSHAIGGSDEITPASIGAVPTTRTVNGKALSANITLAASDVSAVPTTRTVNGKALSANITLSASDVGAATMNEVNSAIQTAIGNAIGGGY